ncbi:unnamed protein product, partial [Coregonus sp. 'balchen']
MASSNGLCRYGARIDCCWGWTRRSWGHCQHKNSNGTLLVPVQRCLRSNPQSSRENKHGCKHGDCVGPSKCKCHPGFTGKTCNQEEELDYVTPLTWDSHPPIFLPVDHQPPAGLLMEDVDECATGMAMCPRFRKCINTFGSYICKCHEGFDLQYINGKYQCVVQVQRRLQGDGPRLQTFPPNHHNIIPDSDRKRTTTTIRPPMTAKRVTPTTPKRTTTTPKPTTTTTTTTRAPTTATPPPPPPPPPRTMPPAPRKPVVPTRRPIIPTRRPPVVTRKPYVPPRRPPIPSPPPPTRRTPPVVPTRRPPPPKQPEPVTPVHNTIEKEVTKQRGDVHIPRNNGHNTVLGVDFDIELGNTADEAKDDAEAGYLSCSFDNGLCGWIRDKDGDLHWETTPDPSEVGNKRSGRGARLVLPLTPPWNDGNLCLSFRHKLAGHHVGMLQVFVKKGKQYSPAVWGRTGGSGWRHTQITLWGMGLESQRERQRKKEGKVWRGDRAQGGADSDWTPIQGPRAPLGRRGISVCLSTNKRTAPNLSTNYKTVPNLFTNKKTEPNLSTNKKTEPNLSTNKKTEPNLSTNKTEPSPSTNNKTAPKLSTSKKTAPNHMGERGSPMRSPTTPTLSLQLSITRFLTINLCMPR